MARPVARGHRLHALAVLASLALGSVGCLAPPQVPYVTPSTLFFRDHCPLAEYEVVKEVTITDRGMGLPLIGLGVDAPEDLAKEIAAEVGRAGGDAIIDLQVRSDLRAIIYFLIFFEIYPRQEISGKVIRFLSEECRLDGVGS